MKKFYDLLNNNKMDAGQIIVMGFIFLIFIGTLLLMLPISNNYGQWTNPIDAMFTATSAMCVTGLVVVNTSVYWSVFGKIIILMLIQMGGIGFVAVLTVMYLILGKKITLRERKVIQSSFNQSNLDGMVKFTWLVVRGTFFIEGIGAILLMLYFLFIQGENILVALVYGIFHSISAFCNAGFDILGLNSLMNYDTSIYMNVVIMFLIILGGIGYGVWVDVINIFFKKKSKIRFRKKLEKLSLHSKLAIITSIVLILIGTVFTFFVEFLNSDTIGSYSLSEKLLTSLFQSVTLRTAGFNTIDLASLNEGTKFLYIMIMMVGGSPGGTAGGLKTVTIAVIFLTVYSIIKGKEDTEVFYRKIPFTVIQKCMTILGLYMSLFITGTILLTILDYNLLQNFDFIDIMFEVASALGTVGLTVGITPELSYIGKIIVAIIMFLGRLGPVTIAMALTLRQDINNAVIKHPEEDVIVG